MKTCIYSIENSFRVHSYKMNTTKEILHCRVFLTNLLIFLTQENHHFKRESRKRTKYKYSLLKNKVVIEEFFFILSRYVESMKSLYTNRV